MTKEIPLEFVLKLARADNLTDAEAEDAILMNITDAEQHKDFPHFLHIIEPSSCYPETKLLDDKARARLTRVIDKYINKKARRVD